MIEEAVILLVEDNPDDEELTRRALKKNNLCNELVVAHDDQKALGYLFGTGVYQGRDPSVMSQVVLLDLRLPKVSGLEVSERIRSDESTRRLPVVILTSSEEEQACMEGYLRADDSCVCKPVDILEFHEAVRELGMYWVLLNEVPKM